MLVFFLYNFSQSSRELHSFVDGGTFISPWMASYKLAPCSSAKSAVIQQYFSLTVNQRTVLWTNETNRPSIATSEANRSADVRARAFRLQAVKLDRRHHLLSRTAYTVHVHTWRTKPIERHLNSSLSVLAASRYQAYSTVLREQASIHLDDKANNTSSRRVSAIHVRTETSQ
jgi:hypothetical protein